MAERIGDVADWLALAEANTTGPYRPTLPDVARRRLKRQALYYALKHLDRTNHDRAHDLLTSMLAESDNLTDRAAALRGLVGLASLSTEERDTHLDAFYRQWSSEALVVDQWFSVQAQSALPGGLDRVRVLETHEAFNLSNPNKVRALVYAFALHNPRNFHDGDAGYRWLREKIVDLDAINPQVAARLARALVVWRRHDAARGATMRATLQWLQERDLSTDTREVIAKGLDVHSFDQTRPGQSGIPSSESNSTSFETSG